VRAICNERGIDQVDAIVCGLPWSIFSPALQTELLEATLSVLRPGGQFTTFAYLQGLMLPTGRRFRDRLHECFSSVERSPTVWRNFPPAFVYRCRR
jgi:phospholipid N-methyltransferase